MTFKLISIPVFIVAKVKVMGLKLLLGADIHPI